MYSDLKGITLVGSGISVSDLFWQEAVLILKSSTNPKDQANRN
ncbi:hypothetical protein C943_02842 [Mariniradius saccharolyticus AK6]|uniref:Uncharacterized protein n=1 Tax=Mariniradius saccharolyticus AK6 TaxID=1239962 RepID=M7YCQ4_9BACT|nr:hypothetical protein C943_02842 [Mariniradius saccharolyticus AK6]